MMIPAADVVAAIGYKSDTYIAREFGVTDRTVRRWKRTGLPLYYGAKNITPAM